MTIPPILKKPVVIGGLTVGVVWLLYNLFRSSGDTQPTTSAGLATDPALIQAGMEYNLASKQLDVQAHEIDSNSDVQKYLADIGFKTVQENNTSYLSGLNIQSQAALQSQQMQTGLDREKAQWDYNLASFQTATAQNMAGIDAEARKVEAQYAKDAQIGAAKASKKKGFSFGGLSLSW